MVAQKASRSQGGCITGAGWQCRVSWGQRIIKCKVIGTMGKQQCTVDDITQDRVVDFARAGQGREHDKGAQQGGGQNGAEQREGHGKRVNRVEGKRRGMEWHARMWQGPGTSEAGAGAHSAQGRVKALNIP